MARVESDWRRRSRQAIERVLSGLRPETPEADVRRLVSAAYPFGERAHHPYKIWLSEVKAQMARRFPQSRPAPARAEPLFALRDCGKGGLALAVDCPWCKGKCVVCSRMHEQIRPVLCDAQYLGLAASVVDDPFARAALCDWLEERGIVVDRQTPDPT